eukprot:GHVT01102252.1.p1 GENE.GHVT01102252.1~~GHVT01102252.1.p1  ORF type:complete len:279 (+),score=41.63 GHVT01102252.1:366-1202(+)
MERLAPHTRWHCSIPTVAVLLLAVVAAAASVVRPAQSLAIVGGQRVPNNKAMAFVPPGAGATSAASVARRRSSVAAAPGRTAGQLNSHTSTTIHTSGTASGRLMRLFPGGSPGHSSVSLSATAVAPALSIEAPPHTEIPGVDSPASSSSSPSSLGQHVLDGVKLPGPLMPVGDVILAERRDVEEKTAGGLILPNDVCTHYTSQTNCKSQYFKPPNPSATWPNSFAACSLDKLTRTDEVTTTHSRDVYTPATRKLHIRRTGRNSFPVAVGGYPLEGSER